eukprot:9497833-Pyramimonas_sp.AAC.1
MAKYTPTPVKQQRSFPSTGAKSLVALQFGLPDEHPLHSYIQRVDGSGGQFKNKTHQHFDWKLSKGQFQNNLKSKQKDTAAGPDGIPHSAWQNSGPVANEALYQLYEYCLAGGRLQDNFNYCRAAFSPKGEVVNFGEE